VMERRILLSAVAFCDGKTTLYASIHKPRDIDSGETYVP